MAIRIPWDETEAVILLSALVSVYQNEMTRSEAIRSVSLQLRRRAICNGVEIDDVFRNINGITLQMSVMEYIFTEGARGLKKTSMPKLFQDVVSIYRNDKEKFIRIAKEAVLMKEEKTIEEQFFTWLSTQVSSSQLSDLYTAFQNINDFCLDRKILRKPLFQTTDLTALGRVRDTVESNKVFRFTYKRQLSKMSAGFRQYIAFIKAHPEMTTREDKIIENKPEQPEEYTKPSCLLNEDDLLNYLKRSGLVYIDNRGRSGCLWVIGDNSIRDILDPIKTKGVVFHYKPEGGKATGGKAAWWTKDHVLKSKVVISSPVASEATVQTCCIELFDFTNPSKLAFTKPISLTYFGDEIKDISTWTQLYVKTAECLLEDYPKVLRGLVNSNINGHRRIDFADEISANTMTAPKKVAEDLYIETNLSAIDITSKIRHLLDLCCVDYENLEIKYASRPQDPEPKFGTKKDDKSSNINQEKMAFIEWMQNTGSATAAFPANTSSMISDEIKEKYEHILTTYFGEDGYQPGRAIFRGRFKRFYVSEYGVEPSENDERIDDLLQLVGTMRDGRIYPKQDGEQNDLLREIIDDIMAAFEEGASGIYIEAVFNKYQSQLAESLQIYNMDALTPMLLAYGDGKFTQRYSYLVKKRGNADSASDVLRIMQSFHEPQNYKSIHKKAWYIPYDKMKTLLVGDKSIVNVAPESYFYAPNLPINSSEIQHLISVIRTELEYRSYITDVELVDLIKEKCPSVAINTDSFTTYGLRNCLGYILREQFSFNGPIISPLGKELSMSDVYAEFARTHEELSFEDLKRLSIDMDIGIYWDSVLGEMVRVSEKKMIRRDMISFDVDFIDNILDGMCPDQYVSIKDINLFLQFPNIGYAWNHYVLESYLFKNSRKFKLLHVSFGQNSVCGAMVRSDSPITDYRTLIVEDLSKSNALGSTKNALQYIVDRGYQQRRRYDGIEQLIQEARLIKEQRENEEK